MVDNSGALGRGREGAGGGEEERREGGRSVVAGMGSSVTIGSSRHATCSGLASALHFPCEQERLVCEY